jgi:signal transduction histidine kinase
MNLVDFLPLVSAIFVLALGLIVFLKNKKSRVHFTFFLHSLSITAWLFCTFMMFINKGNAELAIFWDRLVYAGVVFIPAFMYHFGLAFMGKKRNFIFYAGYFLSFLFLLLSRTEYFVDEVFEYRWGIHTKAQEFHHVFLIYFVVYVAFWFVEMFKYYKNLDSPIRKQQAKYIFFGFLLLFTIGPLAYLPAYGFGIYPFAYFSGLVFTIVIAYAIIKHRLMDIRLIMRRSSVYFFSLSSLLLMAALARFILNDFVFEKTNWVDLSILIVATLFFPSVRNFYYRLANKYFFCSLYDSQKLLAGLSKKLSSTLSVNKIYNYIYKSLDDAFHLEAFGVMQIENGGKSEEKYIAKFSRGFKIGNRKKISGDPEFYKKFITRNEPLVIEEIKNMSSGRKDILMTDFLRKYGAEVIIPLKTGEKIIGIIILGKKESEAIYNSEDIQVLEIIGSQAAMAIQNALQYETAKNFNTRLQREIKAATKKLIFTNKKLRKMDKVKSEFISIASHQLRTPLTSIKGFASLLLEGSYGKLSSEKKDVLKKIYTSNERLIALVENLLNISRIEQGRMEYDFQKADLKSSVRDVVREMKFQAKKKKLILKFKNLSKKIPLIKIDRDKITEAVETLIDNSIKYTEKGSITVSLEKKGKFVRIAISDTGIGINPNEILKLFEKFSRGKDVHKFHTEGNGLGLFIARKLVEAHGGRVWAESPGEGKGSTFFIELPIK